MTASRSSLCDHPGSPGTSAANLTCSTHTAGGPGTGSRPYQVSLRCSWRAGEAAPEDTRYSLYYRLVAAGAAGGRRLGS